MDRIKQFFARNLWLIIVLLAIVISFACLWMFTGMRDTVHFPGSTTVVQTNQYQPNYKIVFDPADDKSQAPAIKLKEPDKE